MKQKESETKWYYGGVSAMFATACTHPLDTLKVRVQCSKSNQSIYRIFREIIRNDSVLKFYSGLSASLLRQATYTSTRFAVYGITKEKLNASFEYYPTFVKFVSAIFAGVIGGLVGTPFDLINVRMQSSHKETIGTRNYAHIFQGFTKILKHEGTRHLYRGLQANLCRSVLMTVSQLATYDTLHGSLKQLNGSDGLKIHFAASLVSGVICTTVTNPIDVIKTRIMIGVKKKGVVEVFHNIIRSEGVSALLKGWLPSYARLGPHTLIMFMCFEQLKQL